MKIAMKHHEIYYMRIVLENYYYFFLFSASNYISIFPFINESYKKIINYSEM